MAKKTVISGSGRSAGARPSSAFTIVELLIVIVIIGILAAITIVSYSGITQKANTAALQSDLTNASKKLALYYTVNNTYPTAIDQNTGCPTAPTPDTENCIKVKAGTTLSYYGNAKNFTLSLGNNNSNATINNDSSPKTLSLAAPTDCPAGYIPVPGSLTYGTSGFCVMKYEAKIQGNDNGNQTYSSAFVPESRATGTPWVNINQINAVSEAATACVGCHLISEAEWMTLAQNVLSVPSNWSGGAVGSGYIYSGHNDNVPANSLAASTDGDGYSGTGNNSADAAVANGVVGKAQKRTLTLTNSEVIWDMAGNVIEWTDDWLSGGQPGVTGSGFAGREYTSVTNTGLLKVNPMPASTNINGSSAWTSANGIGTVIGNTEETIQRVTVRSCDWSCGIHTGVLLLSLANSPYNPHFNFGFRVAR